MTLISRLRAANLRLLPGHLFGGPQWIVLGVNKKLWDSIDKETQDIMKKAAVEAMELNVKLTREDEAKQLDEMKKKGLQVNVLTPEQIKVFQASVTSVYKEQEPIIGKALLDMFVAAGK